MSWSIVKEKSERSIKTSSTFILLFFFFLLIPACDSRPSRSVHLRSLLQFFLVMALAWPQMAEEVLSSHTNRRGSFETIAFVVSWLSSFANYLLLPAVTR